MKIAFIVIINLLLVVVALRLGLHEFEGFRENFVQRILAIVGLFSIGRGACEILVGALKLR